MSMASQSSLARGISRRYVVDVVDNVTRTIMDIATPIIEESNKKDSSCKEYLIPVTSVQLTYPCFIMATVFSFGEKDVCLYSVLVLSTNPASLGMKKVLDNSNNVINEYPKTLNDFFDRSANSLLPSMLTAFAHDIRVKTNCINEPVLVGEYCAPLFTDGDQLVRNPDFVVNWLYELSNANQSQVSILRNMTRNSDDINTEIFNCAFLQGNVRNSYTLNRESLTDINGNPVRSDISIKLAVTPNNTSANDFTTSSGKDLVVTHGYIDTSYNYDNSIQKPVSENSYLANYQVQKQVRDNFVPPYDAVFVMTAFEAVRTDGVPATTEVVIAAILNSTIMINPGIWQPLSYNPASGDADVLDRLNDIDITRCETDVILKKDEKLNYKEYLDAFWAKSPIFAIDITVNGPNYFALKPFLESNETEIIEAAARFFNISADKFTALLAGQPVVGDKLNVLGGVYQDAKGKRDIRQIDNYISAMNLLVKSPVDRGAFDALIMSSRKGWTGAINEDDRVAQRYAIQNHIAFDSFQVTGDVVRCILTPGFINAIIKAAEMNRVVINPTNARREVNQHLYTGLNLRNYALNANAGIFRNL